MYQRELEPFAKTLLNQFPILAILGPRQSGKTTLVKHIFPTHPYVSLENLSSREFALSDPQGFLETHRNHQGLIIDEVQYAPQLFSYIQVEVDSSQKVGQFILTGSQNFQLNAHISQSLAGRIALLTLFPFSMNELAVAEELPDAYEALVFQGGYPRVHAQKIPPFIWYPNYIQTYVERDLRQLKNVADLALFQKFVRLCAGRVGQLINWSDLGRDCGISYNTAKQWVSLLATSYLVFLLPPYFNNTNKRLVKTPKLYFYDTGLACSLLHIESIKQLETHPLKGNLFESFIISELYKNQWHKGKYPQFYFWRDKLGHEIDCLIEKENQWIPIEIKAGKTIVTDFFKGLEYWQKLTHHSSSNPFLIYGGTEEQKRRQCHVLGWNALLKLV